MKFEIVTIFPDFFRGPLEHGILRRAREAGLVEVQVVDLRDFTHDRHRTVDDRPFGGGEGMVLKPEPIFECLEAQSVAPRETRLAGAARESVVLLSAQGKRFDQGVAQQLARLERVTLICGRYEGVDERVNDFLADCELSIGDYVLSGGELAAAVVVDAVTRLLPGRWAMRPPPARSLFRRIRKALELPARNPPPPALPAGCSITRITPARQSFAAWRCPTCWSPATTRRFAAGAAAWPWKRRCATVLTCWSRPTSAPRTSV